MRLSYFPIISEEARRDPSSTLGGSGGIRTHASEETGKSLKYSVLVSKYLEIKGWESNFLSHFSIYNSTRILIWETEATERRQKGKTNFLVLCGIFFHRVEIGRKERISNFNSGGNINNRVVERPNFSFYFRSFFRLESEATNVKFTRMFSFAA